VSDEQTVDNLKLPPNNQSVDYADMTDDDLKHLVIYYATIVRDPKNWNEETVKKVTGTWGSWPKEFRERFHKMVWDEADKMRTSTDKPFWSRPADNNIRYGI
jgi:hypothetical protein